MGKQSLYRPAAGGIFRTRYIPTVGIIFGMIKIGRFFMKSERLFHRDFSIMIVGQIMSLFGNSILRFALSLYVLDATGSAAVFGGILALSMIPTVFLSPIGGFLADRLPRQKIMVVLDFSTAALIAVFTIVFRLGGAIPAIAATMMLLSVIQACYQPSVQSSIPSLTADQNLAAANGIVVQVQALATFLGPILAGFLYGFLGIIPILIASCVCFFLSAVMELFLHIPYHKPERSAAPLRQMKLDLGDALRFLRRDNPALLRLLVVIACLNLFLSALFAVGLPFLIRIHLGLSAQLNGFAEASLSLGSILGGLLSGLVAKRIGFQRSHVFLLGTAVSLLPIVLALWLGLPPMISYGVILLCLILGMGAAVLFNIAAQTYMQQATPPELLGKVSSFVTTICVCAYPIGQGMYGVLLETFRANVWLVVLFAAVMGLILAYVTGRALKKFSNGPKISEQIEPSV